MHRFWLMLVPLLVLAGNAAAGVRAVHTIEPRAFGYFLGDTLERIVEIETGPDDEIVPASLPRTGPSNYWLELRSIEHTSTHQGDGRLHRLKLVYQTFYAPIDPRKLAIPTTEITVRGPAGSETAAIPPFTFLMSPLREIFPEKSGETSETFLRPDVPPEFSRSGLLRTAALTALGFSALFLALLARDLAWWPFHRRPARPFSRAVREIGQSLAKGSAEGYKTALLALHRAFDTAAGQRLLAADVDIFLAKHPEHDEAREQVTRFFSASRTVFFGDAQRDGEINMPPSELKELAASLARQEREAR
ncbi:nonribosomal peptide synthetase MxaA [Hyphomicrobium sp.]|uniref:nonribosomal peptide synthetase MxaA n=1 Tax=Hyphomicrobium sp. TaxID=82 RepID=UPI002E2F7906|nr:nonribosomal peptide synthetase MxaA [Hyphomicrobium sp.]HEX2842548.1 nonribosomal peptide synthetase MxaA [Hyphomicrobium sp.]